MGIILPNIGLCRICTFKEIQNMGLGFSISFDALQMNRIANFGKVHLV